MAIVLSIIVGVCIALFVNTIMPNIGHRKWWTAVSLLLILVFVIGLRSELYTDQAIEELREELK